jgi:hypothetical protein
MEEQLSAYQASKQRRQHEAEEFERRVQEAVDERLRVAVEESSVRARIAFVGGFCECQLRGFARDLQIPESALRAGMAEVFHDSSRRSQLGIQDRGSVRVATAARLQVGPLEAAGDTHDGLQGLPGDTVARRGRPAKAAATKQSSKKGYLLRDLVEQFAKPQTPEEFVEWVQRNRDPRAQRGAKQTIDMALDAGILRKHGKKLALGVGSYEEAEEIRQKRRYAVQREYREERQKLSPPAALAQLTKALAKGPKTRRELQTATGLSMPVVNAFSTSNIRYGKWKKVKDGRVSLP